MEKEINYGRAYAFFYCKASKEEIEAELPFIRKCAKTPSELELSLTEGIESLSGDDVLKTIAGEVMDSGMRYFLEAKYRGSTNEKTADEVADILNQTSLYFDGEFGGKIVYQDENGVYELR